MTSNNLTVEVKVYYSRLEAALGKAWAAKEFGK
jgi:hypothetical protein